MVRIPRGWAFKWNDNQNIHAHKIPHSVEIPYIPVIFVPYLMMILLGSKAIVWILLIRTNALRAPETLKRKLFEDVDVLSTNRNGGLPGHFTSQHKSKVPQTLVPNRDP